MPPVSTYLPQTEDGELVLAQAIADIEAQKGRVRIEEDDLKQTYLAGQYRSIGMTKANCERNLSMFKGEILGYEAALSILYKMRDSAGD